MPQITIPHDSNIRYLPLIYFLPESMIVKFPLLYNLPRKVRDILYNNDMRTLIESDACLSEIMDSVAAMVFPHFGFGGWKEDYTGYCPVWTLTYVLPLWAKLLEQEINWGLNALIQVPNIPFLDEDFINKTMERVVKRAIAEQGWQPILDVVREMPCDEDFEKWNTNVRKDFLRKWYHTRSKKVQTVSLEACMEDDDNGIHEIASDSCDIAEYVASDDFYQRFKALLSERDMKILELRMKGFTYEEIADKLGYKNHSGVLKRMNSITKIFIQYENQQ